MTDSNFLSSFQRHFFSLNLTCSISFEISADRLIDSFKVSLFFSSSCKFFTLSLFHWHYYDVPLCGFLSISLVCGSKYVLNLWLDASISFGKFSAMISSNCFYPILFLLTYDSNYTYVRLFYCPHVWLFGIFCFFSLYFGLDVFLLTFLPIY